MTDYKAKRRKLYKINSDTEETKKPKETMRETLNRLGYDDKTLNNCGISSW